MTFSFSALDTSRPVRELLPRVTGTEAWEGFPEEPLWRVLEAGGHSSLERSLKIEPELLHPLRFNYYYRDRPKQALERWLFFHEAVRQGFPLPRFDPGIRGDEILQLVAGLDFRADPRSSRVKLWLLTSSASELFQEALAETKIASLSPRPHPGTTILWGYDLGLDGTRTFKMYPRFSSESETGSEELVMRSVPSHLRHLIGACRRVYLGVRDGESGGETSFHFLPRSMPDFLRRLASERLERWIRQLQLEERAAIVSISRSGGPDGGADTYGVYYSDS